MILRRPACTIPLPSKKRGRDARTTITAQLSGQRFRLPTKKGRHICRPCNSIVHL